MSDFDKEYFFILMPEDESLPCLVPDKGTAEKPYEGEVSNGKKPLIFYNGSLEMQKERDITPIDPLPDILFNGSYPVVCDAIAYELRELKIPNLAFQSAVFIDHKDAWHENYWFLTFTAEFDCWDRKTSSFDPVPFNTKPPLYSVYTYSLNESLLLKTPLPESLLFKMGGTQDGFIVVHKSILNFFRIKGVDVVPIGEYGVSYP
jgi:hypothetical protein